MALSKQALRGAGWAVAGGYGAQILAFVLFMVTSRIVGPAAFGAVAIAIGMVEVCRAFTTENVAGNLVAQGKFSEDSFNAGFVLTIATSVIASAILSLLAPFAAPLFHTPALAHVLPQISLLLICYGASRLQEARLVQQMRFRALAIRSIAAVLIGGGAGVALAKAGLGVFALVWQQWTTALVSLVLLWIACDWRPRLRFSRNAFSQLNRVSLALAPAGIVTNFAMMLDGFAVAAFSGPAAAGIYALGKRVRTAMQLALASGLGRVSLPTFAAVKHNPAQLGATITDAMSVTFIAVFPIFFGLAAVAPDLVDLFLGRAWAPAAAPMALLLIGGAPAIATTYAENILLVLEQRRWIVALRVLFLVSLAAGILLCGRFGPIGVAAAALAATLLQNVCELIAAARIARFPLAMYLSTFLAPLLISFAMFVLLTALRQTVELPHVDAPVRLPLQIALGAIFYAGATLILSRGPLRSAWQAARAAR